MTDMFHKCTVCFLITCIHPSSAFLGLPVKTVMKGWPRHIRLGSNFTPESDLSQLLVELHWEVSRLKGVLPSR